MLRCGPSVHFKLFINYYTDVVPAVINEIQEDGVTFIESVTSNDEGNIIHKKLQNTGLKERWAIWQSDNRHWSPAYLCPQTVNNYNSR